MTAQTAPAPAREHDLPEDAIVATCHGIDVPAAPHLGPGMIASLARGAYERREFEAARAAIRPGARILELGAGSGFVGAAIARHCAPEAVLSFEANPALLPHIARLYSVNGLEDVISVRHAVVLSAPDAPETATFHVRGNFLGSGLAVAKNPEKAQAVDVPVVRYDLLKAGFPHDVLVMDIEGAEEAFLADADLAGVETVIFEAHRQIYGREGMRACRRALDGAGFAFDADLSKGGVHVWRRADIAAPEPEPEPARALFRSRRSAESDDPVFTGRIERIAEAIVVPEQRGGPPLACGVLGPDGAFAELSRGWIRAFKSTEVPDLHQDEEPERLDGRHLFAGHLRGHFGHFLVESTARLWALSEEGIRPDGILYLPYGGKRRAAQKALTAFRPFFDRLGIDIPIRIVPGPLRVEELILPELGFGWRSRFAGSPAYRSFMRSRLSAPGTPEGSEDLYISRTRLSAEKGGLVGESVIEQNLSALGYEVFHPQKHDIDTQIARYRAARRIVALDGSALHLAACVAEPGTRVAIILRRSKANQDDYRLQFRTFAGLEPDIVDAIRADWAGGPQPKSNFRSVGEVNFEALFRDLASLGYIPGDAPLNLPDTAERERMVADFAEKRADGLRPL